MELVVVKTEDVYPDENNPREDFSGTEELAETFWLNPERPGEPFQPPLLVRDGGIYRIYDGERRYRAICHNKLESFTANVCDDLEEADVLVAMLATNDKKPLTEIEASRGVQRMLMLGVDPVKVEKAGRMDKGRAGQVATAMALVDDAAEDMSLDRLYAVAEFSDDPEAVETLMNCRETDWAYTAQRIRNERNDRKLVAQIMEKADELGIEIHPDDEMSYDEGWRYEYRYNVKTPDDLERAYSEDPGLGFGIKGTHVYVYSRKVESEEDNRAEEELAKKVDELADSFEAVFSELRAWFSQRVAARGASALANTRDLVLDAYKEENDYDKVEEEFPEIAEASAFSLVDYAIGYRTAFPWHSFDRAYIRTLLKGHDGWMLQNSLPDMSELFRAAEADGFAFEGKAVAAYEAVADYMARDADGEEGE